MISVFSSKILDNFVAISFAIGVFVTHLIKTFSFFSLNSSKVFTSVAPRPYNSIYWFSVFVGDYK
jgi:hypothetical protein